MMIKVFHRKGTGQGGSFVLRVIVHGSEEVAE